MRPPEYPLVFDLATLGVLLMGLFWAFLLFFAYFEGWIVKRRRSARGRGERHQKVEPRISAKQELEILRMIQRAAKRQPRRREWN